MTLYAGNYAASSIPGILPVAPRFDFDEQTGVEAEAPARYEVFRLRDAIPFGLNMWFHKPTIAIVAAATERDAIRYASFHYEVIFTEEFHLHNRELAQRAYDMKRSFWCSFV